MRTKYFDAILQIIGRMRSYLVDVPRRKYKMRQAISQVLNTRVLILSVIAFAVCQGQTL